MLTIRPEQLEAFDPVAEANFERRVAEYMRENHADVAVKLPSGEGESKAVEVKALDDETLLRLARTGIARARSYGMTWESSITAFVVLTFVAAPNFDDHPLIRRVLEDAGVEPDQRIEQLWDQTTEENWEIAASNYDASRWGLTPEEV
jgi:hypothetical protein